MTLDIRVPAFWQLDRVDHELRRVYDICAGCRRCLPLCPSFKVMFDRLDVDAVDGDVEKLPASDVKEVVDLCYQCKLCYNHCPYTPPHRWAVDFPRLMLRARSAEARAHGVTLQDRFLGNTELVGRIGSLTAPISNWMNAVWVNRKWLPVEVLGRWVGPELLPNEIGYRVRLLGGEEITLVREPLAQWFADPGAALQ